MTFANGSLAGDKKILMVYTRGGAPMEYAIPRISARGELHILELEPLPSHTRSLWQSSVSGVIDGKDTAPTADAVRERIVREARRLGAAGIITLSEFSVESLAQAARELGLPGAGPNAARARDKRQMREIWSKAGVPSPRFRPVTSAAELRAAYRDLTPPLLLKAAWGSGSVGQLILAEESDVDQTWAAATGTVLAAHASGFMRMQQPDAEKDFLVEEIIQSSIRTWWPEDSGYGDYLSVEGIVAGGTYHPLCITSRLPTIPPFTELSNLAPCVLAGPLQSQIEAVARAAVDALELENCGTHTELKLKDNGELAVLETAARLGGVMVAPEIERVYGYDAIGTLTDVLLGEQADFPVRMFTDADAKGAAGSLSLIATDAAGRSWNQHPVWDQSVVDWSRLLTPGSSARLVPGLSIQDGTTVPAYDSAGGARGYGGIFFVQAADARTLVGDCYSILNGLEQALVEGWARPENASSDASRR
jgi:biotin carboxylase